MDTTCRYTNKYTKIHFKIKDIALNKLLYDAVKQFNLRISDNNYKLQIQFQLDSFNVYKIIHLKDMQCIPIDIYVYDKVGNERVILSKNFHVEELSVCSLHEDTDNILCTITFTNVKL